VKLGELQKLVGSVAGLAPAEAQKQLQSLVMTLGLDPNALYQELEMTSPLVDTHRDTSSSNFQVQLHSHAFFELLYCTSSGGAEYLVGSERYRVQRGDILFVPPGISHRPLLPPNMSAPYARYVLWLSADFLRMYAGFFPYQFAEKQAEVGMLRTAGTKWESLGELFRSGVHEAERRADGWEAAVIGNTILLLTQIKRATDERSVRVMTAESPELLDRITAFVESNYSTRFTIEDLSRQLYVSSSSVSHLFKEKMGVSFYRYVTQRRLIAAKPLIEKSLPLEDVCRLVGFSDYSGFYRAFKQEYGISPRQYRNRQAANSK
jgi:AraC-like DNA-binding protein/mannose-6-phosphate isomerase-like protein (cupin superfamily)